MDDEIEARLRRAGLTDEQIQAERDRYAGLDPDGQRLYVAWAEQVSDEDIAGAVDGDDRTPPVVTHAAQPQLGYVPVGRADDTALPPSPVAEVTSPDDGDQGDGDQGDGDQGDGDPSDGAAGQPPARKTGSRKEKHDE